MDHPRFRAWPLCVLIIALAAIAHAADSISGEYKRVDAAGKLDRHAASLSVSVLKDGRVRVVGDSSWIGNASTGDVNVGEAGGIVALQGNRALFKGGDGSDCRFTITFSRDSLMVTDDNLQCGGLNVSFDGRYRKVK